MTLDRVYKELMPCIDINNESAWIGKKPYLKSVALNICDATNCRVDPKHHGQYELVWCIEKNIFSFTNSWMLIIDESIRLIGKVGKLVVRTSDTKDGTLFGLKSFLYRNPNLRVKLIHQINDEKSTITLMEITRLDYSAYKDMTWTIGILSNGEKNDNVIKLINSINEIKSGLELEFIIAGPKIPELLSVEKISYVDFVDDGLPRISEKKNNILKKAKNINVALFHDRYIVNKDFFIGFSAFGYDFDYVGIRQFYDSGVEFPSYLAFHEKSKTWQTPIIIKKYDQVLTSSFLNGGLIILKKKKGFSKLFNDLLLHNEAEDVELGFYMSDHGVCPRFNFLSTAKTIGLDETYTSTFTDIENYNQFEKKSWAMNITRRVIFRGWILLPPWLKKKIREHSFSEYVKSLYRN